MTNEKSFPIEGGGTFEPYFCRLKDDLPGVGFSIQFPGVGVPRHGTGRVVREKTLACFETLADIAGKVLTADELEAIIARLMGHQREARHAA